MKKIPINPRNPNGFSAVELIAVLVLMALISALALPTLSYRPKSSLLATAMQTIIVYDSLARSHAKSNSTPVTMTIIPSENLITLFCPDGTWNKSTQLPSGGLITGITVNANAKTVNSVSIPFSSAGWSAPYQIEFSSISPATQTKSITLQFNSFTGPDYSQK